MTNEKNKNESEDNVMSYVVEKKNGNWVVSTKIGELLWVRPSTVKGARMTRAYDSSAYTCLYQAYNKPSEYKKEAWDDCKRWCREMGGYGLKITSSNCHKFSAAFKCKIHSYDTEEVIVYITKDFFYCVPVQERRW